MQLNKQEKLEFKKGFSLGIAVSVVTVMLGSFLGVLLIELLE